jgi:predicted membrane protein
MYLTPHRSSAMAMFGFVYLWYLMVVLLLEIWLDYRRDIVLLARSRTGFLRVIYKIMTLGSDNISERSLHLDERVGYIITVIGIPSAFLLHGYVGFIFGSIKANPWWSSPLMPVVFIFSAMVSGIAAVMLLYMLLTRMRGRRVNIDCVDAIAKYLFYIFLIDFSLEMLDLKGSIYRRIDQTLSVGRRLAGLESGEPRIHRSIDLNLHQLAAGAPAQLGAGAPQIMRRYAGNADFG